MVPQGTQHYSLNFTSGKIINKHTLKRITNIVVKSMVENTSDKRALVKSGSSHF